MPFGIITPSTRSLPSAFAQSAATTVESFPPLMPITTFVSLLPFFCIQSCIHLIQASVISATLNTYGFIVVYFLVPSFSCQRHAESRVSSTVFSAFHPSSVFAQVGSAHTFSISPALRPTIL